MERTVQSHVHKTVRRVSVTSQRAPVWVVSLDTEEIGVQKVSGHIKIMKKKPLLTKLPLKKMPTGCHQNIYPYTRSLFVT